VSWVVGSRPTARATMMRYRALSAWWVTKDRHFRTVGMGQGGRTAAAIYGLVGTCKHLSIDPFAYVLKALAGLFSLRENPTEEQLTRWLPDRWLLRGAALIRRTEAS